MHRKVTVWITEIAIAGAIGAQSATASIPVGPVSLVNLAVAAEENVLWSFGATADDGQNPSGGLLADWRGNLYGTPQLGGVGDVPDGGDGTVFELSLPY